MNIINISNFETPITVLRYGIIEKDIEFAPIIGINNDNNIGTLITCNFAIIIFRKI